MNGAVISPYGQYRYRLDREWLAGSGAVLFVMFNASTADAERDDPTVRRLAFRVVACLNGGRQGRMEVP